MTKPWYPQRKTLDAPIALLKTFVLHIGHSISRSTIEKDVRAHAEFPALSFEAFVEILNGWGMKAIADPVGIDKLSVLPTPSITLIEEMDKGLQMGIPVLFFGVENDEVCYLHPRKGWVYDSLSDFETKWCKALISLHDIVGEGETDFEQKEKEYDLALASHPERHIVQFMDQMLSDSECDHIIKISNDRYIRSQAGEIGEELNARTSYSAYLTINDDPILNAIREKIAQRLEIPVTHFEYFQCVSYANGQEYQNHYDTFDATKKGAEAIMNNGGQRKFTLLVYLNDDFEGGQTYFPKLDLLATPKKGNAVFFHNINQEGVLYNASFHAGLPVSKGKKYAFNLWIREREVTL